MLAGLGVGVWRSGLSAVVGGRSNENTGFSSKIDRSLEQKIYRTYLTAFMTSPRVAAAGLAVVVWRSGLSVEVGGRSNVKWRI